MKTKKLLISSLIIIGSFQIINIFPSFISLSYAQNIIEGEIIKTKVHKNEIYVKTSEGRKEIYLSKDVKIKKGDQDLKIEDLKAGIKVKVTDKTLVEILQ